MADSSSNTASQVTAERDLSSSSSDQLQSLAKDYATISQLVVQLDTQVKTMTQSVGTMVRSVPAHDGMSATLESLGDSTAAAMSSGDSDRQCQKKSRKNGKKEGGDEDEDDAAIMGDEASTEKDDPLVFL